MATALWNYVTQRRSQPSSPYVFPYKLSQNPYRTKKIWPPQFGELSSKHQFRLERRYRRRAQLQWARPGWKKGTKLVQWGLIGIVLYYMAVYVEMDPRDGQLTERGDGQGTAWNLFHKWYTGRMDEVKQERYVPLRRGGPLPPGSETVIHPQTSVK